MKKSRVRAVSTAVAASVMVSGAACGKEQSGAYFSPHVDTALAYARGAAMAFWAIRGVGDLKVDQFNFLEGPETVPNLCGEKVQLDGKRELPPKEKIASDDNVPPGICRIGDGRIVLTPMNISTDWGLPEERKGIPAAESALAQLIVWHETTHLAQLQRGIYDSLPGDQAERQADCYAGVLTALSRTEDLMYYREIMDGVASDEEYGDRRASFERGFADAANQGQVCDLPFTG